MDSGRRQYRGLALESQRVERLSSADLLVGLAAVPLRILETQWIDEPGCPDALWIYLSSGRDFTLRFDPRGGSRVPDCYERENEVDAESLGLGLAALLDFDRQLAERYAEDMARVES